MAARRDPPCGRRDLPASRLGRRPPALMSRHRQQRRGQRACGQRGGRVRRPAPRLSALRITPTAFRAANSGPSDRRKGSRGATVTFVSTSSATVTFSVQRARSGREINGRCRRDSRSHPKARRCAIWSAVSGSFRVTGKRGTNRLTFTGRIGGRKLDPGRYRLVARARDAAGSHGKPVPARFSIRT